MSPSSSSAAARRASRSAASVPKRGIEHVVFERHGKFHSWRENRWDSFCLVTPNWQCRLPDFPYTGRRSGWLHAEGRDRRLSRRPSPTSFDPPLREGVTVTRVAHGPAAALTSKPRHGDLDAPIRSSSPPAAMTPRSSRPMRRRSRPGDLPDAFARLSPSRAVPRGRRLVVGTGQSGVQLMEDLHPRPGARCILPSGPRRAQPAQIPGPRRHRLALRRGPLRHHHRRASRSGEGADARPTTTCPGATAGNEIDLRRFALDDGVSLYGSVADMDGTTIRFLPRSAKRTSTMPTAAMSASAT